MVTSGERRGPRGEGRMGQGCTGHPRIGAVLACIVMGGVATSRAADVEEAERLFRAGRYDECVQLAKGEIRGNLWDEPWSLLKIRAELARGEAEAAMETFRRG